MSEIKAFEGWRYNKDKVRNLVSVLAPPYDVISKEQQERFYQMNPHNVIRLILGKTKSGDSIRQNQYTRARDYLYDWISNDYLMKDNKPSIYVYVQNYKESGKLRERIGFMAAMKINEGEVLKHENTLAKPKKDRMALLKEVRTNLSPIFGLFEDKQGTVQKALKGSLKLSPALDVSVDGVRHRLYVEDREEQVSRISRALSSKPMLIADGHHRFEVACQYKRLMHSKFPDLQDAAWNYVMTYFSDLTHNPFKIFPTHRLIQVPKSMKDPLDVLAKRGRLSKAGSLQQVLSALSQPRIALKKKAYSFGIYKRKEGFFLLDLDPKLSAQIKKNPVDQLDVAVLHRMLIEPCFKIKAIEKSSAIDFTRDAEEAKVLVDKGKFDLALFLRPTSLSEMVLASKKGMKMPQKSTYFYPKLLSGLVFHRFENNGVGR